GRDESPAVLQLHLALRLLMGTHVPAEVHCMNGAELERKSRLNSFAGLRVRSRALSEDAAGYRNTASDNFRPDRRKRPKLPSARGYRTLGQRLVAPAGA